jgi:hypothetical protein
MNIIIIVKLRKRQRLMTIAANSTQSTVLISKKKEKLHHLEKRFSYKLNTSDKSQEIDLIKSSNHLSLPATHKDQSTITDLPISRTKAKNPQVVTRLKTNVPKRHHSRDRTITMMLVSVALSYLILTLPYRLFWSYNVYIKRMHPEKLNSSIYLLKMHHIDHILRTIRNIHYSTNFVFFIFLSKTFRRKFRQLFIGKFLHASNRLFNIKSNHKTNHSPKSPSKVEQEK